MKYEVKFTLNVEDDNNLFSLLDDDIEILEDTIINALRDVDDIEIVDLDVYKR